MIKIRYAMLAGLALLTVLASACALTQPGGIDTPEGQDELAEIADISQQTCMEAARAAKDEDGIKIEAALAIVRKGLLEQTTLAQVQGDFQQIGLKSAWASRAGFLYSMGTRRIRRYVTLPEVVAAIADTVVDSCRAGVASANLTTAIEHTPAIDWQS